MVHHFNVDSNIYDHFLFDCWERQVGSLVLWLQHPPSLCKWNPKDTILILSSSSIIISLSTAGVVSAPSWSFDCSWHTASGWPRCRQARSSTLIGRSRSCLLIGRISRRRWLREREEFSFHRNLLRGENFYNSCTCGKVLFWLFFFESFPSVMYFAPNFTYFLFLARGELQNWQDGRCLFPRRTSGLSGRKSQAEALDTQPASAPSVKISNSV